MTDVQTDPDAPPPCEICGTPWHRTAPGGWTRYCGCPQPPVPYVPRPAGQRVDATMRSVADFLNLRGAAREIGPDDVLDVPKTGRQMRQLVWRVIQSADRTNPTLDVLRETLSDVEKKGRLP